jgi:hypothetical protein
MGMKFTDAPMPPREIKIEGQNFEFQRLANLLELLLEEVPPVKLEIGAFSGEDIDTVQNLIDCLRGSV